MSVPEPKFVHSALAGLTGLVDIDAASEISLKVEAGLLPFDGRWLTAEEIGTRYSEMKRGDYVVLSECCALLFGLAGTAGLLFMLLKVLCGA